MGCASNGADEIISLDPLIWSEYSNDTYEYSVGIPKATFSLEKSNTGSRIFFSNVKRFEENTLDALSIEIFGSNTLDHCNNIGISEPSENSDKYGNLVIKGHVDEVPWDSDPVPVPNCMIGKKDKGEIYSASYILCSEKGDRKVAICIKQITDNPALAEQIFSTFRWND